MEPLQHRTHTPRKRNSAKVNVTISVVIHVIIFVVGALWAAHEGMLGDKLKTLSASILDKEKKVETKKEEPKQAEVKKVSEQPKIAEVVKATAPPPPAFVPPTTAGAPPPPPAITFGGGDLGFSQDALNDPMIHYKQSVESTLRSKWDRPTDIDDAAYVAEVEVALDATGKITGREWKKGSGDKRWDDSVRKALASTTAVSRPPPKGFPEKFLVRFDVESTKTEPVLQASAQ